MSNWREQIEEESELRVVSAWLSDYYHYLLVAALMVFAFWIRVRNWGRYVVDGQILFRGNDPWYHYRSIQYVVEHFPATMPFDPWTYFPYGTSNSQFGTIYDQLVGLAALVLGLGSPSEELVRQVALFAPAVFGVAIAIPTYLIARRYGGRFAGVVGVGIFALATDRLLQLSVAGFGDHQVAEALFQAVAVLAFLVALRAAHKEKPVYELLVEREFATVRKSIGWAILAGVAISAYLWVWPPGVLLLGILGVFLVIHLSFEYLRGQSPDHVAFVAAIALTTTGLLQLSSTHSLDISATGRSLLQPGLAFAVAAGAVFMAWLAREWDDRDLLKYGYPATVVGILAAGALFMYLALPGLFHFFLNNTLRVLGLQTSAVAGTIGEAQPLPLGSLYSYYTFAIVGAVAGLSIIVGRQWLGTEQRAEELLLGIWFVFIVMASLTQARFAYYLTVPVAALNAVMVGFVMQFVGDADDLLDVEPYQVMAVLAVVLIVVAPMGVVGANAVTAGGQSQAPGGIVGWDSSLDWLSEETPAEGQYGAPNGTEMDYLGTYARTDDYNYSSGAYGVMSWWDYGHWITAQGERIPNANPFQQGASEAAAYLLSQSENESIDVLNSIDEDDADTRFVMVDWKMAETESLRPVRGKFFAPPNFLDNVSQSDFYTRIFSNERYEQTQNIFSSTLLLRHKQAYYESTVARLYLYHGSAQAPQPYVVDWSGAEREFRAGETAVSAPQDGRTVKFFPNMSAAEAFVEQDGTAQIGGVGPYPEERVPALEHYRLVHMSEMNALSGGERSAFQRTVALSGLGQQIEAQLGGGANQTAVSNRAYNFLYPTTPSWTKTFERVPGATLTGEGGPVNTTLTVAVQLTPRNGSPFRYTQQVTTDANGAFETTVPYGTVDYDQVGPETGYTNTSVRAAGPYTITTGFSPTEDGNLTRWSAQVNVSELKVVGAEDSPVNVDLEKQTIQTETGNESTDDQPENTTDATEGNESTDSQSENTTDGSGDSANSTGSDGTSGNDTQGSLVAPLQSEIPATLSP